MIGPMVFMLIMPAWAMLWQLLVSDAGGKPGWILQENPNWLLVVMALSTLALEIWMVTEAVLLWPRVRGRLEPALG
jgi:carbon starvation protein